ncbi:MAG: hypothetical protein IH840_15490, partial [Candidatus Heimdallarchaeota archaeon]|nr:hypothetical protein [Candidatus Heimdallarchaeota archaeon]
MTDQSEYSEQELEDLVIHHKKKYYDGEPEIPDEEYDRLEDLLRGMNANNAALFIVGTPVGGKVEHDPPMLSSAKASSLDEVVKWAAKIDSRSLYAGYKVDGFSLSIVYNNGVMIQASTRGNGQFGDDVSHAVLKVKDIPKTIPDQSKIDIRGELYMAISEFNRINDELLLEDQFSSPRNLAVGTMKQKDLASIANRKLHFKAFDMIGFDHDKSIHEISTTLHLWGFDPADVIHIEENSPDNIDEVFREIEQKRSELDFEIDGVIFKYNEFKDRQNAGSTEHHPKWQIAWKFA